MIRSLPFSISILFVLASCVSGGVERDARFYRAGEPGSDWSRSSLFRITKNENANYVCYDLVLDGTGRLTESSLDVYWIMAAADGNREELNGIEQGIYGVTITDLVPEDGVLGFQINAMESKRFDVDLSSADQEIETYTTIDGQRAVITQIHLFVHATWNPFNPDVEIQLDGLSGAENGSSPVTELIRD